MMSVLDLEIFIILLIYLLNSQKLGSTKKLDPMPSKSNINKARERFLNGEKRAPCK
jgi:hypothetical protein